MTPDPSSPSDVYFGLRNLFFTPSSDSSDGTPSLQDQPPSAVLMEMNLPEAVVTLMAAASGDASLYFSTGGGVLGGIGHEHVRTAAQRFVALAQNFTTWMHTTASYPLPSVDSVRYYVATSQGILTIEVDGRRLEEGSNNLAPLYDAGQDVITELGIMAERQGM